MSRIETFMAMVNEKFLEGASMEKLQLLWKEISKVEVCTELVKHGERKGAECGKACVKGKDKCLCHLPRVVVEKTNECVEILKSGPNKGNPCGKKCATEMCSVHTKKHKDDEKKEEKKDGNIMCSYVSKKGKSCEKISNSTMCKKHLKKTNKVEIAAYESSDVVDVVDVAAIAAPMVFRCTHIRKNKKVCGKKCKSGETCKHHSK